jgi:hypothetical protein
VTWRKELSEYDEAKLALGRAERLLADAIFHHDIARQSGARPLGPMAAGVELARRRALREERHLAQARLRLTRGRPLDEVLWSLPDEV